MTGVLRRRGDTQGEGHVKMETETGVTQPQKLGRGKEGHSPKAFRGHGPANTLILDFRPPELKHGRIYTQLVVIGFSSHRKLIQILKMTILLKSCSRLY